MGGTEEVLAEKFAVLLPHLDERRRRLVLGADARALGHGGIRLVAQEAGVSEDTVSRGAAELDLGEPPTGRTRAAGAGRCGRRTRTWSARCWRWSSPTSAGTRSPRCGGR